MPSTPDELALLQLERDWIATWQKQDPVALDGILADGFVENYQGQTTTKKQMIADMKAGIRKVESAEVSDMRAVVFGDQAIVNGISTAKGTERGKIVDSRMRYTDVFEKRDGRWRARCSYIADIK
jgi:ketosteroid isomerase-like protein